MSRSTTCTARAGFSPPCSTSSSRVGTTSYAGAGATCTSVARMRSRFAPTAAWTRPATRAAAVPAWSLAPEPSGLAVERRDLAVLTCAFAQGLFEPHGFQRRFEQLDEPSHAVAWRRARKQFLLRVDAEVDACRKLPVEPR